MSNQPNTSDVPNVLSIAGTDPTGGAGVQADIKTISACGGYAMSIITAVVAQNTTGVQQVELIRNELAELSEIITDKNADKLDAYLTRLRENIGQGEGMV